MIFSNEKLRWYKIMFYEKLHFMWPSFVNLVPGNYAPLPPVVIFILTFKCNMNCKMCSVPEKNLKEEVNFPRYKKMLDNVNEAYKFYPYKPIIWFTGGEIFLVQDIRKILDYTYKLGFRYGFLSNLTVLPVEIVDDMSKHDILEIRVSLDGDEKIHDKFRGRKGTFKKVISNLNKLKKKNIPVKLTSILYPGLENIKIMLKICEEKSIDIYFQHLLFIKKNSARDFEYQFNIMHRFVYPKDFQINYENDFKSEDIQNLADNLLLLETNDSKRNVFVYPRLNSVQKVFDYYNTKASMTYAPYNKSISSIAKVLPDGFVIGGSFDSSCNLINNDFNRIWNGKTLRNYRREIGKLGYIPRVFPVSCH
ncbi:MAG: radical SAM protein [Nanobdellota archaeon]